MDEKANTLKKLLPFTQISGFFFSCNLCMCFCPVFPMDLLPASKQFSHFLRNTKTCGAVCCLAERDRKQQKICINFVVVFHSKNYFGRKI